jgi:uncharacterized membrane protein
MAITPALIVHVSAGSIGILSGVVAVSVRKGGRLHRAAGNVFFVSMLTMAAMATYLAALIPQRNNVIGGIFVVYLVATSWMTVRRKEGSVGPFEYIAILVVMAVVIADFMFGLQATHNPKGMLDGFLPRSTSAPLPSRRSARPETSGRFCAAESQAHDASRAICGACAWRCSSLQARSLSGSKRSCRSSCTDHRSFWRWELRLCS